MSVDINWLAVALATLSSMVVGSVWYAKPVFGSLWMRLAKLDEKKMEQNAAKTMPRIMGIALIMSFLAAFVIAHVAALSKAFYDISALEAGLTTAFWLWVGISATTVVVHDIFEQRPAKLTLLTVGNQFFTLLAMGLIIGLFGGF
jgi:UDP-N-acetylmuramyl pentapeptide phosphotransferase/UDP-N-acetylglucosamine-1-phosphate transferase